VYRKKAIKTATGQKPRLCCLHNAVIIKPRQSCRCTGRSFIFCYMQCRSTLSSLLVGHGTFDCVCPLFSI